MSLIISNRTLKFYNNEKVFDASSKQQARFFSVLVNANEVIPEANPTLEVPDILRYLLYLSSFQTVKRRELSDGRIVDVDTLENLKDLPGVVVERNFITISEQTQKDYRIPFSKIEFVGTTSYRKRGNIADSFLSESERDIKFHFRNKNWVKVFYSRQVFLEFLERGDLDGEQYGAVPDVSDQDLIDSAETTMAALGLGYTKFLNTTTPRTGGAPVGSRIVYTLLDSLGRPLQLTEEQYDSLSRACEGERVTGYTPTNLAPSNSNDAILTEYGLGATAIVFSLSPRDVDYDPPRDTARTVPCAAIRTARRGRVEIPSGPTERNIEGASSSNTFVDFTVETQAQVSETELRLKQDEVSTLQFLVDEEYNYLAREYEFGDRAPANRTNTDIPEQNLPSIYGASVLFYLNNKYQEELRRGAAAGILGQYNAKAIEIGRNYGLLPGDPLNQFSSLITEQFFDRYGFNAKNLTPELTEILVNNYTKEKYSILDSDIINNFTFPTLFPAVNRIEIVDLPSEDKIITNALIETQLEPATNVRLMEQIRDPDPAILTNVFAFETYSGYAPKANRIINIKRFSLQDFLNTLNNPIVIDFVNGAPLDAYRGVGDDIAEMRVLNNEFLTPYLANTDLDEIIGLDGLTAFPQILEAVESASRRSIVGPRDLFLGRKNNYFEPIAYRIRKKNILTGNTQEFLLSNKPEERVQFFDSQLKINQEYNYNLSSINVVLENQYYYKTPDASKFTVVSGDRISDNQFVLGATMVITHDPKIVELPLSFEKSVNTDDAPIMPNVEFFAIKDYNDRVRIRLSSMNSVEYAYPILIDQGPDTSLFDKISQSQRVNFGEKIRFSSDETPMAYEVYRLERKPTNIRDFLPTRRVVRSIAYGEENSDGTLFEDRIIPNQEYYYLFRTLDFHGKISNPTEIFKFVLVDNEGALQPLLTSMPLSEYFGQLETFPSIRSGLFAQQIQQKQPREVRKFIEITPATNQISFIRGQFADKTSDEISTVYLGDPSIRFSSFDPDKATEAASEILGSKFLIELVSKKTGKPIYIELDYVLNDIKLRERTDAERRRVRTTVTEQDIADALARRDDIAVTEDGPIGTVLPPETTNTETGSAAPPPLSDEARNLFRRGAVVDSDAFAESITTGGTGTVDGTVRQNIQESATRSGALTSGPVDLI